MDPGWLVLSGRHPSGDIDQDSRFLKSIPTRATRPCWQAIGRALLIDGPAEPCIASTRVSLNFLSACFPPTPAFALPAHRRTAWQGSLRTFLHGPSPYVPEEPELSRPLQVRGPQHPLSVISFLRSCCSLYVLTLSILGQRVRLVADDEAARSGHCCWRKLKRAIASPSRGGRSSNNDLGGRSFRRGCTTRPIRFALRPARASNRRPFCSRSTIDAILRSATIGLAALPPTLLPPC